MPKPRRERAVGRRDHGPRGAASGRPQEDVHVGAAFRQRDRRAKRGALEARAVDGGEEVRGLVGREGRPEGIAARVEARAARDEAIDRATEGAHARRCARRRESVADVAGSVRKLKNRRHRARGVDAAARERLVAALRADERIIFAYLFGSQADGTAGPRSDVDVAAWFREPVPREAALDLNGLIAGAVQSDKVDAVVLNSAPLTLAFEILKGHVLVSRDEGVRVDATAAIMSRYHDRIYYIRRHLDDFADRVRERGFG